jgi:hypothetical protein
MEELFPEGFWFSLSRFIAQDGSRGLWPYVISEDMLKKHKECLKIAKSQKTEWILSDYTLRSYHSKWNDTTTPYVRYCGDPMQKWYYDIAGEMIFDDHQPSSIIDNYVTGVFKLLNMEDTHINRALNNFYLQYLEMVDPYLTKEVALQMLGAVKYGHLGVERVGGDDKSRISLSSLIVMIGETLDSLFVLDRWSCTGSFLYVWDWTIQAERVYSSLRDYPQAIGMKGVSYIPNKSTMANKIKADGSIEVVEGRWSTEFVAQANAMTMLKLLRADLIVAAILPDPFGSFKCTNT